MLKVEHLNVHYGAIHAIQDISFTVNEGEIVTLIGANGAGKTSTLHAIAGLVPPRTGVIEFCGEDLRAVKTLPVVNGIAKSLHRTGVKLCGRGGVAKAFGNALQAFPDGSRLITDPYKIVGKGMAQVPEGRRVFSQMTVKENLQMGAYARKDEDIQEDYQRVLELLPRLKERRRQLAGTLSGGEQQMLAIGRALMAKPKMLLLDEPSMGLSPMLVGEIFKIIRDINADGVTVLLVEQNAKMALDIASRAYVLETGRVAMQGPATELADNPEVKKAYLGG